MEIQFYGADCIRVTAKSASVCIDDNLRKLGLKSITKADDILLLTNSPELPDDIEGRLIINQPGEYEVSNTVISGIPARSYSDEPDKLSSTMFKLEAEDIRVLFIGNIFPELSDSQLEIIGTVDVLVIPVGGNGHTLNGDDAIKLVKKIEPKLVVPTLYADKKVKYPQPLSTLEEALSQMNMEVSETVPKLKLKANNFSESETIKLVVLETT